MGLLDKLFGGRGGGLSVEDAVSELAAMYDDPEAKSEGGISITGRRADEIRDVGRRLHKTGGKPAMEAAREAVRARHPWAATNLDNIWSSLPEWRG